MVGKRALPTRAAAQRQPSTTSRPLSSRSNPGDLESGNAAREVYSGSGNGDVHGTNGDAKPRPNLWRFRDAARTALEDRRRDELKQTLLNDIGRDELEKFRKSDDELKEIKNKAVRKFYESQNERLNDWLEVDTIVMAIADDVLESMDPDPDRDGDQERHGGLQDTSGNIYDHLPEDEKARRSKAEWRAKWAININVLANIVLLIGKIVAAFTTGSLSLIASLVDSTLDLLCTLIVWTTNKLVAWRLDGLSKRFPVGRKRLEPLGILVFSIIMVISFMQILKESVEKLMPLKGEPEQLGTVAIAALVATVVIKGTIWFGCIPIKTTQVQALAQDCKTDVNFNTLSLLFPLIGYYANIWWLDPAGAAVLSLYIIYDWGRCFRWQAMGIGTDHIAGSTCFENVTRLSGQAADDATTKKLMYLAYRFSAVVEGFKSVTAYHAGDGLWVEFDVLMDPQTKLYRSHDIAETLQYCCEGLGEVDRCFVSIDYSSTGPSGHATDAERV